METVDLESKLSEDSDGWRTGVFDLKEGERVIDPTRTGQHIYGPAKITVAVPPDGAYVLRVEEGGN